MKQKLCKTPIFTAVLGCSFLFACAAPASSASVSSSALESSSESTFVTSEEQYSPIEVDLGKAEATYQSINAFSGTPVLPSKGEVDVLLVPISFEDYPFAANYKTILTSAFQSEANSYFESVSSFYSKSSFGSLKLNFEIDDALSAGTTESFVSSSYPYFASYGEAGYSLIPQLLMDRALSRYDSANGAGAHKRFDSDKDGFVDAIIFVYSAPDNSKEPSLGQYGGLFWNYCYRPYDGREGNPQDPVGFRYMWLSYSKLFAGVGKSSDIADAHIPIHETGHLFGLSDFYNQASSEGETRQPAGQLTMMANNVLDHDIYAKIALGWAKPILVEESTTIHLSPSQKNGQCLVLADDYNGSGFDEFVVFELYTPTGLNVLDSRTPYPEWEGKQTGYSLSGVRGYHVDSRLVYGAGYTGSNIRFQAEKYMSDEQVKNFSSFDIKTVDYGGNPCKTQISLSVNNSKKYDSSIAFGSGYEEVALIQAGKKATLTNTVWSTDDDLFQTGDRFTLSDYSEFFPRKTKLNNGSPFPYEVSFDEVSENGATITVTRVQ